MSKKILVIGGSGFIGGTLVPNLLKDGHEVTLLNRGNNLMKGTKQLIADRTNEIQVRKIVENAENYDVIIDTSSYCKENTEIAWRYFSNKTKHWIHLSTVAVYKETLGRFPDENDEIGGAEIWGDYGIGKSEADKFLIGVNSRIPITIIRPPYLYGPGNDNDRESFVWSRALQEKSVVIPNEGTTLIQFLHVEDLVGIFKLVISQIPKKLVIYNVASDERITLQKWVTMLCEIAETKDASVLARNNATNYTPRQYFPFRDYPCGAETGLIQKELSWKPIYELEAGFRQTFSKQNLENLKTKVLDTQIENDILERIKH